MPAWLLEWSCLPYSWSAWWSVHASPWEALQGERKDAHRGLGWDPRLPCGTWRALHLGSLNTRPVLTRGANMQPSTHGF